MRRRAVRLCLEESIPPRLVARELGIDKSSIYSWLARYRREGESGLVPKLPGGGHAQTPEPVKAQITALKTENPSHGVRKIALALRRFFCLKASPETVRKELGGQGLLAARPKGRKRRPKEPQFFECDLSRQFSRQSSTLRRSKLSANPL